jgi:hypothetical protein
MSQMPLTWSKKYTWSKTLKWNGLAPNTGPTMPTMTSTDTPIVITITDAQKAAILAKIAELKALLTFVVGMSNDQRKKLLKLADKRVGWDEKAHSYMVSRTDLVPGYVDMAALAQNRAVRVTLGDILRAFNDCGDGLNDTDMIIGHQILKPEYAFYNSCQEAAKHGVAGAQSIVDDLGSGFSGGPHKTTPPAPTPPAH